MVTTDRNPYNISLKQVRETNSHQGTLCDLDPASALDEGGDDQTTPLQLQPPPLLPDRQKTLVSLSSIIEGEDEDYSKRGEVDDGDEKKRKRRSSRTLDGAAATMRISGLIPNSLAEQISFDLDFDLMKEVIRNFSKWFLDMWLIIEKHDRSSLDSSVKPHLPR